MLARLEDHGGRVRLIVQHETRKRLEFAVDEAIQAVARGGVAVAEFDRDVRPWWTGARKVWTARLTLMGDPPEGLIPALAQQLGARGYRVTIAERPPLEFFGG